jgi:hypothetical protein
MVACVVMVLKPKVVYHILDITLKFRYGDIKVKAKDQQMGDNALTFRCLINERQCIDIEL